MSSDLLSDDLRVLFDVMRKMSEDTVSEALRRARVSHAIPGVVEDIDVERDVVYIRSDDLAAGVDLYQGIAVMPGLVSATRQGNTLTGEQVRALFDGSAGATATNVGVEARIVLPFGATSGKRIIIDGELGVIAFFDENDVLVGLLTTDEWVMGQIDPAGARGSFDPVGGIRLRDANDHIVVILDQNGLTLRDGDTGQVTAEMHRGKIRLVDPAGTNDIELVTSPEGTLPNPSWRATVVINPGSTLNIPAAPLFTTAPPRDLELGHVAAWIRAGSFPSATMTPPPTWTEVLDDVFADPAGTLQIGVASKVPAVGAISPFTSSLSGWQSKVGTHVVLQGAPDGPMPSVRSISTVEQLVTNGQTVVSMTKPPGTADEDALVVFVALGVNGGGIDVSWVVPEGFEFLGAQPVIVGSGATQATLAVGTWVKRAGAAEPADYSTQINLPSGVKMLHATMVAVQDVWLIPGGSQIRVGGRPTRQLLDEVELQGASHVLADFTNISQAFDNLEVEIDGLSDRNGDTAARRLRVRYNGDTGANYFYQLWGANGLNTTGISETRQLIGGIAGVAAPIDSDGSVTTMKLSIQGYSKPGARRASMGQTFWTQALDLRNEQICGQWDSTAAINRITIEVDGTHAAGVARFKSGSRAKLYGY